MSRWQPAHPLHLVLGLSLWSAWFVLVYGGMSVVCSLWPPAINGGSVTPLNPLNLALLLSGLIVTVVLLVAARRGWRSRHALNGQSAPGGDRFLAVVGAAMYVWAAVATLVVALPLLLVPACV